MRPRRSGSRSDMPPRPADWPFGMPSKGITERVTGAGSAGALHGGVDTAHRGAGCRRILLRRPGDHDAALGRGPIPPCGAQAPHPKPKPLQRPVIGRLPHILAFFDTRETFPIPGAAIRITASHRIDHRHSASLRAPYRLSLQTNRRQGRAPLVTPVTV
jgi:hypothetical protein